MSGGTPKLCEDMQVQGVHEGDTGEEVQAEPDQDNMGEMRGGRKRKYVPQEGVEVPSNQAAVQEASSALIPAQGTPFALPGARRIPWVIPRRRVQTQEQQMKWEYSQLEVTISNRRGPNLITRNWITASRKSDRKSGR